MFFLKVRHVVLIRLGGERLSTFWTYPDLFVNEFPAGAIFVGTADIGPGFSGTLLLFWLSVPSTLRVFLGISAPVVPLVVPHH